MDNPLEAGSPPPIQLDQAPRQLPFLPTEILQRIIQLALPRLSFKTFRERYDILLTCCRVNKLWAALAQRELFRHVQCRRKEKVDLLCSTMLRKEVNICSLWLRKSAFVRVASVMELFEGVERLYLTTSQVEEVELHQSTLLRIAQSLQVLGLDYVSLEWQSTPALFPHLRRLALSSCQEPAHLARFLNPTSLPVLKALSIICSRRHPALDDINELTTSIITLAPQLLSFSFSAVAQARDVTLGSDVWSALTSLQHLTLHHDGALLQILPLIPSPLRSFRLRAPINEREDKALDLTALSETFIDTPDCLKSLEHLIIPPIDDDDGTYSMTRSHNTLAPQLGLIHRTCWNRGIEISHEPGERHTRLVEHFEHELSLL